MKHLSIIIFLLPALGWAAEQAEWKQLQQLLGKSITAKEVVDFVKTNELEKTDKGGSGSFAERRQSYSVMFRRDSVSTIVIQASPRPKGYGDPGWTHYAKPLPAGLAPSDDRKAVERKLGSSMGGDWWKHGELTIWVHFNKQESAIDELYVWRTKDKP